jgi:hypothetical protein
MVKKTKKTYKKDSSKNNTFLQKLKSKLFYFSLIGKSDEAIVEIRRLRFSHSLIMLQKIINELPDMYTGMVFKSAKPYSYSDLNIGKVGFIDGDIESHLNWWFIQFDKYSDELKRFLAKKREFEICFLLGKYDESKIIIEYVKENICFSFWEIENSFLLEEYSKGLKENIKLQSKLSEIDPVSPFFPMLCHFYAQKADQDLSVFSYQKALERTLSDFNLSDHVIKHYLSIHLDLFNYEDSNYNGIFLGEECSSIIDRYQTFSNIVGSLISKNEIKDNSLIFLQKLSNNIKDYRLQKLFSIKNRNNFEEIVNDNDAKKVALIIDSYTFGNYDNSVNLSKEYLENNPDAYEIYEIYVKSLIHLNREFEPVTENESVLNIIMEKTYNVISKNENTILSIFDLYALSWNISSFDIAHQIQHFIVSEISTSYISYPFDSLIYSPTITPNFSKYYYDLSDRKSFLETFKSKTERYATVDFFIDLIDFEIDQNHVITSNVPNYRLSLHKSKVLFEMKKYVESIYEIQCITDSVTKIPHLYEECIVRMYDCYFEIDEFDKCIALYVDNYLGNSNIISKFNTKKLSQSIINNKFRNITSDINVPIFLSIIKEDDYKVFVAYDIFMKSLSLSFPSDIDESSYSIDKVVYFLEKVSTPKVLFKSVMVFRNSNDVHDERIRICQKLSDLNMKDLDKYNDEISQITQNVKIKERVKEIDESKIFVDEESILKTDLKELEKKFIRYRKISEILQNENLDFFSNNGGFLVDYLSGKVQRLKSKKLIDTNTQLFNLFMELFFEVRDQFLFSNNNGLDYYLSSRIRHGIIDGQLRRQFQSYKLITQKDSVSGKYVSNEYWNNRLYYLPEDSLVSLNHVLNKFSENIDNIIYDLKNKYIHIATEDKSTKQDGLFDFRYYDSRIHEILFYNKFLDNYKDVTDYREFINKIILDLWEITDYNLVVIRNFISGTIKPIFTKFLDNLEVDIKGLLDKNEQKELIKNITECRTNIQMDIDTISTWFQRTKNKKVDFEIIDSVDTSAEIIKNIYPSYNLKIEKLIESKSVVRGEYFTDLVDLFKIFFENIIGYCKDKSLKEIKCKVLIIEDNEFCICEIQNPLIDNENVKIIESIIRNKLDELNSPSSIKNIRGEGNTGIIKADNILKNKLRSSLNSIDISVKELNFCVVFKFNLSCLVRA